MTGSNITDIVDKFKLMSNTERLVYLGVLLEGEAITTADFTWRATLCTSLRDADVYPEPEEDKGPVR